jgi:hypothetical protein
VRGDGRITVPPRSALHSADRQKLADPAQQRPEIAGNEHGATIFDAIRENVATKQDLRLAVAELQA